MFKKFIWVYKSNYLLHTQARNGTRHDSQIHSYFKVLFLLFMETQFSSPWVDLSRPVKEAKDWNLFMESRNIEKFIFGQNVFNWDWSVVRKKCVVMFSKLILLFPVSIWLIRYRMQKWLVDRPLFIQDFFVASSQEQLHRKKQIFF